MGKKDSGTVIGQCPICDRDMVSGPSIDKHHFTPKCKGGKESKYVHKVCHNKIHATFTEKELANEYNDPEKIKSHPEMEKFLSFVRKKDPEFYDKNDQHKRKRR